MNRGYLRRYHPRPRADVNLVCLPHAGGVATAFRDWGAALPPGIELVCVQYPGRQDRLGDPFAPDLPTLVDELVAELPTDRTLALFGHSMGATVAFEAARRLGPAHLFLSAPPTGRDPLDFSTEERLLASVRRLGGSGAALLDNPEVRRLALPAIRHDLTILDAHRITEGAPLACPVTVLVGKSDTGSTAADAGVWAGRTEGALDVVEFPGGHHYVEDAGDDLVALFARRLEALPGAR
ncbi:thioesterase II family protein [Streptomyces sp. NPDC050560]|uniref:thioesterase II family protein n=1 Tax=Streptomyces sp. NPDC050560 TaxID=3365630 RepID=UPI00379E2B56